MILLIWHRLLDAGIVCLWAGSCGCSAKEAKEQIDGKTIDNDKDRAEVARRYSSITNIALSLLAVAPKPRSLIGILRGGDVSLVDCTIIYKYTFTYIPVICIYAYEGNR